MSTNTEDKPRTGAGPFWTMGTGTLLLIIGIIVGSMKVGSLCGSPFDPDSFAAEYYDAIGGSGAAASCRESIASANIVTWALIAIGVILFVAGLIMRSINRSRPLRTEQSVAPAAPGIGAQIEDLARLRDQGLLTPEEFEAKKAELLARL